MADTTNSRSKIAVVVEGLFEKSDSIGYDAVSQFQSFRRLCGPSVEVRLFAEICAPGQYSDVPIENVTRLKDWVARNTDVTIVYHWCDGWPTFTDWLMSAHCRIIVRWHNNTPPWFFGRYSVKPVRNTVRGYRGILTLAEKRSVEFWPNSEYSGKQLAFLGIEPERHHVVYPASKYLDDEGSRDFSAEISHHPAKSLRILFVGRLAPHKGHKHLIAVSSILKKALDREVTLILPGRPDGSMPDYLSDLGRLSHDLDIKVDFPGEIDHDGLTQLYHDADVFLCLSEHEGFGLPVFEAMRMGLPVVGIRSTAFQELLAEHPLAIDEIEYSAIASRVIAALAPDVRHAVADWQRHFLSCVYTKNVVDTQILNGMDGVSLDSVSVRPYDSGVTDRITSVNQEWATKLERIVAEMPALRQIPRDERTRFVTVHDIETYEALLSNGRLGSDLFDDVMNTRFQSTRRFIGPVLRGLRRAALSIQSGLVKGLALLDERINRRCDTVDLGISDLRRSVEQLRRSQEQMNSRLNLDAAPDTLPAPKCQPGTHAAATRTAQILTVGATRSGTDFGTTAEFYSRTYFEGDKTKSNYSSYIRDAAGPSGLLARSLFDIFSPASALDAGCAVGYTVKAMRELGVDAYGCDISEWAVAEADVPFIVRFDFSLEPIRGRFDLVFCYDVVEHIPEDRLQFALTNLWNATTGTLVVVPALYPEGTTSDPNEPTHLIFHDRDWWASFLQNRCGITLDEVDTARLDLSEHSKIFQYSGRVFVATRRR